MEVWLRGYVMSIQSRWLRSWRQEVLERDGYRCRVCKCNERSQLQIHHLNPKSLYPDQRQEPQNGLTLCGSCHIRYHRSAPIEVVNLDHFKVWWGLVTTDEFPQHLTAVGLAGG